MFVCFRMPLTQAERSKNYRERKAYINAKAFKEKDAGRKSDVLERLTKDAAKYRIYRAHINNPKTQKQNGEAVTDETEP